MKKFLFVALFGFFVNSAQADDVIVNKNVLNLLSSTQNASAPKFPIMPKRVAKPRVIKKPVMPKAVAPKPVATVVEAAKAVAPVGEAPKVEALKANDQALLEKEFEAMQPIAQSAIIEEKTQAHMPKTLELMPGQKVAPIKETKVEQTKIETTPVVKKDIEPVKKVEQSKPVVGQIFFESFEAKLTDANKKKVDETIATFKDPINNKISIIAYNVEDGADAFKKKRQVLNHALDIRNYLAAKGYNNLSLRVLSVKNQPNKTNLVEISEM